ncbi:hypothetical protein ACHWQZ_G015773 [Mnemiopsis leidyi]
MSNPRRGETNVGQERCIRWEKNVDSGGYDYVMKYSVATHVISSETDPIRITERQLCRTTSSTTTWRFSKNRSKKCPCFVYFNAMESLARVSQRARAKFSVSVNHPEALTSAEFELTPSCQLTQRDEDFVAYYGRTEKGPGGTSTSLQKCLTSVAPKQ